MVHSGLNAGTLGFSMGAVPPTSLNFGFLAVHHQRLVLLGAQAEQVFHSDPLATLMRLRQLTESRSYRLHPRESIPRRANRQPSQ